MANGPAVDLSTKQPRVVVTARRTNALTGATGDATVTLELRRRENGLLVAIAQGGVTGHDMFYVQDFLARRGWRGEASCEWTACSGMRERWDKLVIGDAEMRRAFAALGVEVTP